MIEVGLFGVGVGFVGEDGFDEIHGFLKSYMKPHINALFFDVVIVLHLCSLKVIILGNISNPKSLIEISFDRYHI